MNTLRERMKDIFWLPSTVLFFVGVLDIIRGFMHTFALTYAATNIAKLDMAAPGDQVFLLGVFGISNLLTGFLYFMISRKARELSPYVLGVIPLAYLLGLVGITSSGVHGQAAFEGKYFMLVYLATCIITFLAFLWQRSRSQSNVQRSSRQ